MCDSLTTTHTIPVLITDSDAYYFNDSYKNTIKVTDLTKKYGTAIYNNTKKVTIVYYVYCFYTNYAEIKYISFEEDNLEDIGDFIKSNPDLIEFILQNMMRKLF